MYFRAGWAEKRSGNDLRPLPLHLISALRFFHHHHEARAYLCIGTSAKLVFFDNVYMYNNIPDAIRALDILNHDPSAYGQVWHLPSTQTALTGRQFVRVAAKYMNSSEKIMVLAKWLLKAIGLSNPFKQQSGLSIIIKLKFLSCSI